MLISLVTWNTSKAMNEKGIRLSGDEMTGLEYFFYDLTEDLAALTNHLKNSAEAEQHIEDITRLMNNIEIACKNFLGRVNTTHPNKEPVGKDKHLISHNLKCKAQEFFLRLTKIKQRFKHLNSEIFSNKQNTLIEQLNLFIKSLKKSQEHIINYDFLDYFKTIPDMIEQKCIETNFYSKKREWPEYDYYSIPELPENTEIIIEESENMLSENMLVDTEPVSTYSPHNLPQDFLNELNNLYTKIDNCEADGCIEVGSANDQKKIIEKDIIEILNKKQEINNQTAALSKLIKDCTACCKAASLFGKEFLTIEKFLKGDDMDHFLKELSILLNKIPEQGLTKDLIAEIKSFINIWTPRCIADIAQDLQINLEFQNLGFTSIYSRHNITSNIIKELIKNFSTEISDQKKVPIQQIVTLNDIINGWINSYEIIKLFGKDFLLIEEICPPHDTLNLYQEHHELTRKLNIQTINEQDIAEIKNFVDRWINKYKKQDLQTAYTHTNAEAENFENLTQLYIKFKDLSLRLNEKIQNYALLDYIDYVDAEEELNTIKQAIDTGINDHKEKVTQSTSMEEQLMMQFELYNLVGQEIIHIQDILEVFKQSALSLQFKNEHNKFKARMSNPDSINKNLIGELLTWIISWNNRIYPYESSGNKLMLIRKKSSASNNNTIDLLLPFYTDTFDGNLDKINLLNQWSAEFKLENIKNFWEEPQTHISHIQNILKSMEQYDLLNILDQDVQNSNNINDLLTTWSNRIFAYEGISRRIIFIRQNLKLIHKEDLLASDIKNIVDIKENILKETNNNIPTYLKKEPVISRLNNLVTNWTTQLNSGSLREELLEAILQEISPSRFNDFTLLNK